VNAPAVDPARLARAVHLRAEPLGQGLWRVTGGDAPHLVDIETGSCDCVDYRLLGTRCKHVLAVRLAVLEPETRGALRDVVPMPKRVRRTAATR